MAQAVFEIVTPKFTGPFDLLLAAIKENELDVFEVSISSITSAYFEHLRKLEIVNLNQASEFLFMAALLLEMKSKKLLPQPQEIELQMEEEEIEAELAAHLEEYRMFKTLAATLKGKKEAFHRVYSRYHREVLGPENKDFYLKDVNLQDLVLAFKRVWDAIAQEERVRDIREEEITLPKKVEEVLGLITAAENGLPFEHLFTRHTRIEVVVTFLAILELAKSGRIKIAQGEKFGGIRIYRA